MDYIFIHNENDVPVTLDPETTYRIAGSPKIVTDSNGAPVTTIYRVII